MADNPKEETVVQMNDAEATKTEADASVGAVASAGDSAIEGVKAAIEAAERTDKTAAQMGKSTDCGDKCGPLGPCMSLFGDMFQIFTAPVAGPTWVWYLYILVVLGTFTFFLVNLGLLTAEWSTSSVTEVALKWEKELSYPDIYMCLPAAVYYHAFKCCGYNCNATHTGGTDPYSKCGSWGFLGLARSKTDADPTAGCQSFGKFGDFSRHYRADSCPYTTHVGASFPSQRNYYLESPDFIQGLRPKVVQSQSGIGYGQFPTHAYATALENALPTFTPQADSTFGGSNVGGGMTGTTVKSVCYYFQVTDAANAKAVYGTQSYLQNMFVATMTDALMRELPHLKIYLMPQGKQPTDSTGVIATEVTWPAVAMKTIGDITIDKYKDETKGETEWTYLYNMGLSSQPVTGQLVASMSPAMTAVVNVTPPLTYGSQYTDSGTGENKVFGMIPRFKYRFDDVLDIDLTKLATTGNVTSNSKCFYSGGDEKPDAEMSPANSGLFGTNLVGAFNALTISNFVVREITIRNRTVSEYWSAIGGLFAGSLLILSIFFAASGVTHNNRIVQTFNFMGKEEQEQWLEPYQPEDKLAELEKKVEALTASLNRL